MNKFTTILAIFFTAIFLAACGTGDKESGNKDAGAGENAATEESTDKGEMDESVSGGKEDAENLQLLENNDIGEYLADSNGMTLYYFKNDEPETSNCTGECLDKWPPFTDKGLAVPEGFDKSDFATIKRKDTNEEQVTYRGYPLYYFVNDKQNGDVNGQGEKDVWYIINKKTEFQ